MRYGQAAARAQAPPASPRRRDALTSAAAWRAVSTRAGAAHPLRRGLHSSTSQLNLSATYGIGGARRNCVARVKGVLGGV